VSNEVKKELTLALLRSPIHSTREIARVLGYTEPTAFHAAFKSWMNETPAKWRERHNINVPE
jgi:AraC-like DNA-binding protein